MKHSNLLLRLATAGTLTLLAALGTPSSLHAAGARIAWVSFHPADNTPSADAATAGFTAAPDVEYTRLLRAAGHDVTRVVTSGTPDVDFLDTFDLVIISRSVPSGDYQDPPETALWHSITKPTMILGGYVLRASRLGYTIGDTMVDTTGTIRLTATDPAHPIFTGVDLDSANTMVNPYAHLVTFNSILQRGISVNMDPDVGGTILATVGTDTDATFGGMIIAEFAAGTIMGNASGDVTAGRRLVFLTGSREQGITANGAGIFDLDPDGVRLFLNAVAYLTGIEVTEPPPLVTNLRPASGTTQWLPSLGLSFEVTSGDPGGIPESNIQLVLNGTDVSASLAIMGTLRARTVSFNGLVTDTDYTGVITVRDAGGRESVVNFTFDTRPAFALPAAFAFPAGTADASAPGMRARLSQTWDTPTLPNTSARAEGQLAGTLIDPVTGEPYTELIIPSSDNPDGAYNQTLINWSVEAGFGVERGNFQAPESPDEPVPGISHNFNIAAEILAYLELTPGRHVMGVNSDDGFVVFSGFHFKDALAVDLGRFDGGRAAADTTFQFDVSEAGLYPFRLLYYQGADAGSLEWFTVDPQSGDKILINDRGDPRAVRAWRRVTAPERPYVVSLDPAPGAGNVALDATLSVVLHDAGAQVQEGSVQLSLNGQAVAARVSKTGGQTTVTYTPAPEFQSDTTYRVSLQFTDSAATERTVSYEFTTRFVPPPVAQGANIVWVSFHPADNEPSAAAAGVGFTEAPDAEYTRLLRAAGHRVTRYVTTPTPDVDFLNTFDLVIISRSVASSGYQQPESTALWHSVSKPMMILGGYILRGSRLGFTTGDTIPDTAGTIHLTVRDPAHPIFRGIALDATHTTVNPYAHLVTYNGTVQRGISVNTSPVVSGGTILATVNRTGDPANGGMILGEFPAGTTMADASADVTAGQRLVFLTGSREQGITAEGAGIYDLEPDGAKLFLNAVAYLAGLELPPAALGLTASVSATGELVISWPEAGSEGVVLQATSALTAPDWQAVPGDPVVSDGRRTVTLSPTGAARFFRLFKP